MYRLTRVDELFRGQYYYLEESDECYFLREYTAGAGYQHSETNQLVWNLKKSVDRKGRPEWHYKEEAIKRFADDLAAALAPSQLATAVLVPMPPSRAKTDKLYDDRLLRILNSVQIHGRAADVRELLVQTESTRSAHRPESPRLKPQEIYRVLQIDRGLLRPRPERVVLFDDLLTTGAHFKAAQQRLRTSLGNVPISGVFLARTVR